MKYKCGSIWGEATQNSCEIYQRFFGREPVKDLLYIPEVKYLKFAEKLRS